MAIHYVGSRAWYPSTLVPVHLAPLAGTMLSVRQAPAIVCNLHQLVIQR
jgi:hypothetical protein